MRQTQESSRFEASVVFLTGPLARSTFNIDKHTFTLGSGPGNDLVIKGDPDIANYHARLLWKDNSWSIEKHSQARSVKLDGQEIQQANLTSNTLVVLSSSTSFRLLPSSDQKNDVDATQSLYPALNISPIPHSGTGILVGPDQTEIAPTPFSRIATPSIEVSHSTSPQKKTHALVKQITMIGRDATNDIVIDDQFVSGLHAQIVYQDNQWVLIHPHPDRKRTVNGLLYHGRRIRGDEYFTKVLTHGDIFRINSDNGSFVTLSFNDGTGVPQEEELPPIQPIKLNDAEITIGRVKGNTVVIPHPQVSAHHARMVRQGGSYRIFDLGSTNHVYVNSEPISNQLLKTGDEIRIGPYRLIFENTHLTQYDESNFIRVEAHNLARYGARNTVLLNNISLAIPPRKFVAIVGGSGAGKSTLLNALSGLSPASQGKVTYNGLDYYRHLTAFKNQIGYVPQDDIVHRDLTVERALYYAAKLRLPADFNKRQIAQRIDEVLEDVELQNRRNLLISKLSGGQRKRVSIAIELLSNPSLFFLDEPTSGLDPGLDRKMMFLLRKLADKGHTIVLVTHATNNINVCDYICFMATGGRLAYFGPPEEAKRYFSQTDFPEIYSDLEPTEENRNVPEEAEVHFKASEDYQKYVAQPLQRSSGLTGEASDKTNGARKKQRKQRSRSNPLKQFFLLSMRNLELLKNNRRNLILLLIQAPLVTMMLMIMVHYEIGTGVFDANKVIQCRSALRVNNSVLVVPGSANATDLIDCAQVADFLNNNASGNAYAQAQGGVNQALQNFIVPTQTSVAAQTTIFMIIFFIVMFGIINSSREIVKEIAIYKRERVVALSLLPYMFSKIGVLGLFSLLQAAEILFIVNFVEPFHQGVFLPVLLEVFISLALVAIAGMMLGLLLSALAHDEDGVNSLLPLGIIPQVILGGAVIPLKDWFTQIAAVVAPVRWAVVAVGSSLGLHSDKIDNGKLFGDDPEYHGTLFSTYSTTDASHHIHLTWLALSILIVSMAILIGILLKRKDARR